MSDFLFANRLVDRNDQIDPEVNYKCTYSRKNL